MTPNTIVFKIRSLADNTPWEDIEPICTLKLFCYEDELDEYAMLLSKISRDGECRWNYEDCTQGHYCTHPDCLDYHFNRHKSELIYLANEAEAAFWKVVYDRYPLYFGTTEAIKGTEFTVHCEEIVQHWLEQNGLY